MQLWKDSLELATLERLTREMNEFAERLIAVKSARLGTLANNMTATVNRIFTELLK